MIESITQDEFYLNEKNQLSSRQVRRLLFWLFRYITVIAFAGLALAMGLHNITGLVIGISTLVITGLYAWRYGMDLYEKKLLSVIGQVKKERIGVKGATHFDIILSDNYRIRALDKAQWLTIQEGVTYKIFFTKRTKWLLSYKLLF